MHCFTSLDQQPTHTKKRNTRGRKSILVVPLCDKSGQTSILIPTLAVYYNTSGNICMVHWQEGHNHPQTTCLQEVNILVKAKDFSSVQSGIKLGSYGTSNQEK